MTLKQFSLLLIPSALWGSSFIFMDVLAPVFGAVLTATLRIVFATIFLFILFKFQKYKVNFKRDWKLFFIIGLGNSAIPFTLYSYAALYIPSSLEVIINSTSPMFGAIFGLYILKDKISTNMIIGLLLGTIGVVFVSSVVTAQNTFEVYISILASLGAAALYGLSGAYVKKYASHIEPKQLTLGSLTLAGSFLVILYLTLFSIGLTPAINSDNLAIDLGLIVIFGIMCTSIPYIIYYKLLQDIGPMKALTVTYLMPVFGIIWALLYGESITGITILGMSIILAGIYFISSNKKKVK